MLLNKYRGFTLAELMIVFTVIGIIAALLAPVLFSISPNTPELKAKKAYNTFVRAVESLTNGEPYESNGGVLDARPFIPGDNTDQVGDQRFNFFCNNIASLLNTNTSNCNSRRDATPGRMNAVDGSGRDLAMNPDSAGGDDAGHFCANLTECENQGRYCEDNRCPQTLWFDPNNNRYVYENLQSSIDWVCMNYMGAMSNHPNTRYNIVTSDGVGWVVQKYDFSNPVSHTYAGVTTSTFYAVVCVNTSNDILANTGRNAFDLTNVYGIGVNRDGKVLPGRKLQVLIDQEFTEAAN